MAEATGTGSEASDHASHTRTVSERPDEAPRARVLRNARVARRVHAGTYLTTALLLLSGLAVMGEGRAAVANLIGGHVAAARWHRWVGYALIGAGLVIPMVRWRAAVGFLAESVRFRPSDIRWFQSYPRFVLRPSHHAPARHEGHFDPGQRVLNCAIVLAFVALASTGVVMSFPEAVIPSVFGWSLRIHRAATWLLVASVAGHLLVATGLLSAYRGVWRAMHRDGRVPADLAAKLWPAWAEARHQPNSR